MWDITKLKRVDNEEEYTYVICVCIFNVAQCISIFGIISWTSSYSETHLVRVEVVVHQLVDDVVRVLQHELQAHGLQRLADVVTRLRQPVRYFLQMILIKSLPSSSLSSK